MSAPKLLEHVIARIEAANQRLNAIVVPDFDRARAMAKAADAAVARGDRLPLLGIPMTLKEPFNTTGLPTTWGYPEFRDFVPTEDALFVSRLKGVGAVVIGKTNIPLGLRDFQSYNDIYGTTNNTWDISRSRRLLGRVSRLARRRLRNSFDRLGHWWIRARACAFLRHLWG
jgi:amidase